MNPPAALHAWDVDPAAALQIQSALRARLTLTWDGRPVRSIAGVDLGYRGDVGRAALVIFSFPDLRPIEAVTAKLPVSFPYIPGLLSFREGPVFLAAWEQLREKPDVVMFDGQGIAHPRGFGIAAHMGLWIDRPAVGVAKSRLYGRHAEVGEQAGDVVPLTDPRSQEAVIGAVLRSKARAKPLYISPGNRIDTPTALQLVQACLAGYRLPEPTRWAHRVAAGARLP